jgi:hypothetical protein
MGRERPRQPERRISLLAMMGAKSSESINAWNMYSRRSVQCNHIYSRIHKRFCKESINTYVV